MRIRAKTTLSALLLIVAVIAIAAADLMWAQRRDVARDYSRRMDLVLDGARRIATEAAVAGDDFMLFSYLKLLLREHPEIELAVVTQGGSTEMIGKAQSDLLMRTIDVPPRSAGADATLIQLGFSKQALHRDIVEAQRDMAVRLIETASLALMFGGLGALWLGRTLSRPILELTQAAHEVEEGRLQAAVNARGRDELGELSRQFNRMTAKIRGLLRFKNDLMSTMTHELNTPLGGIKSYLQHLLDGEPAGDPARSGAPATASEENSRRLDAEGRRDAYRTMIEAVHHMELSIGNALELFKTDSQPELQRREVELSQLIESSMRLLMPIARANDVGIEFELKGAVPPVPGDTELLRRVVLNLISNAVKFTPPGGHVQIVLARISGQVRLSVIDSGPGLAPEDQERLFTEFYRAQGPDGRLRRIPGTGLGLVIAKRAVDLHQGRIWLDSTPGKGSAFHVSLPEEVA